jgi:hypothetical protein
VKRDPNTEAYRLLRRFVPEFRHFIKGQLVVRYGAERWLDGVPGDVRERLTEFEQKWGENPWVAARSESPLDFAYEEDLTRIITDDDNWKNVFRQWFGSDKRVIEIKLREMRWIRDQVAHFRLLDRDQLARVRRVCKDVDMCIARAGNIQADSQAAERFLSPDELLAGEKEPAELVASAQRRAASSDRGDMQAVTEQLAAVEERLLDLIFEQAAYPDESDVKASGIHWRFNEWQRAPETEVLAWQVYVPQEAVSQGSTVYLAIRYNPAALNARAAVKRKAKPPFDSRAWHGRCIIRGPREESRATFVVESEDWACVEYTPNTKGKHDVVWAQESGGRPKTNPWVRREFEVV